MSAQCACRAIAHACYVEGRQPPDLATLLTRAHTARWPSYAREASAAQWHQACDGVEAIYCYSCAPGHYFALASPPPRRGAYQPRLAAYGALVEARPQAHE